MSEVFQNKKALYHYSLTLFLSVTTRSSAVVSDVTYLDSRSCQNLVGLGSIRKLFYIFDKYLYQSLGRHSYFSPVRIILIIINLKEVLQFCIYVLRLTCLIKHYHRITGAFPGFGRGGAKNYFFRFVNLHAAHGKAMRIARGVRGHAPPRNFF